MTHDMRVFVYSQRRRQRRAKKIERNECSRNKRNNPSAMQTNLMNNSTIVDNTSVTCVHRKRISSRTKCLQHITRKLQNAREAQKQCETF